MKRACWVALCALLLSSAQAFAQMYTLTPSPYQLVVDNSGVPVNNGCVWTYTAGTSTPVVTYSDTSGTPNANPIRSDTGGRYRAYLVVGQNYKFVIENSDCVPPAHGSVLWTQDNIAAVPGSASSVDVTGTAGENLTAGQVVYLSDGSGAKNAGQWYKADTATIYSSLSPWIGIAQATINSGSTGTIRVTGEVTGLSALTIGASYYVGASGALSITQSGNARKVGQADTATSLLLTPNQPTYALPADNAINNFRVSASTGVCVPSSDVTAATTLYLVPCYGSAIALYDGTAWITRTTAQISIAVPGTTSQMYDVFVYDNAGAPTLELLAWTNDTTRATALIAQDGVLVKTGATTRRYVASFRTTTVSGQTEDSLTKRYVWNYQNQRRRPLQRLETTASWTWVTGATWHQANAATANQVDVVVGVAQAEIDLTIVAQLQGSGVTTAAIAIGEDSTTVPVGLVPVNNAVTNGTNVSLRMTKYPAVGRHFYAWLEWTSAATLTVYGKGGVGPAEQQSGITGWIEG